MKEEQLPFCEDSSKECYAQRVGAFEGLVEGGATTRGAKEENKAQLATRQARHKQRHATPVTPAARQVRTKCSRCSKARLGRIVATAACTTSADLL